MLADKLGAPAGRTALIALGGYAFAWCVGFVIVFAPAGAGVRDALLILALSPLVGHQAGLAVALVSRGVNTISDLIVAGIAAASRGRGRGKSTVEESTVVEGNTVVEGSTVEGKEPEAVPAEAAATSLSDTGPLG